jgi:hypothetical protein
LQHKTFLPGPETAAAASTAGDILLSIPGSNGHEKLQEGGATLRHGSGDKDVRTMSVKAGCAAGSSTLIDETEVINRPHEVQTHNYAMTHQQDGLVDEHAGPSNAVTQIPHVETCDSEKENWSGDDFFSDNEREDDQQDSEQFQQVAHTWA